MTTLQPLAQFTYNLLRVTKLNTMRPKRRKAAELPRPGAAEPGRLTDCLASTGNREGTDLVAQPVSGAAEPRLKRAVASFKRPASGPETHAASQQTLCEPKRA